MKVSFFGPIENKQIVRTAVNNIFLQDTGLADSDQKLETITVTPDPTSIIGLADSDFGFSTDIDLAFDDSA